jgi:hypothetical protein
MRRLRSSRSWAAAVVGALVCAALGISAQETDVEFVRQKLDTVKWGRYMAKACAPASVAGWEGFPTEKCAYSSGHGNVPVVLLNADNDRMSKWLVTACIDTGITDVRTCAERVAARVKCQSGNQFPVAGFVDERVLYLFRDGVTVSISGIDTGDKIGLDRKPTPEEETLALSTGKVSKVYAYARVQGTTRAQFAAFVGEPVAKFAGDLWRTTIRAEYQAAWTSERNRLVSAWAKANAASLGSSLTFETFIRGACPTNVSWTRWF